MTSNTVETSNNFRAVPLADQLVSVKPIKGPIETTLALRRIYSTYDEFLAEYKKQRHMNEIKEVGLNDKSEELRKYAESIGKQ